MFVQKKQKQNMGAHSKQSAGREELKVMEAMFSIAVGRVASTHCYEEGWKRGSLSHYPLAR